MVVIHSQMYEVKTLKFYTHSVAKVNIAPLC